VQRDRGPEPGRVGDRRRERKGREAGVLRGRESGEKYKRLIFFIYYAFKDFQKQEPKML